MASKNNSTWCPVPWMSLSVRNSGDFRVCCHANQGAGRGILRKNDGTAYNAAKDSFESVRNSETLMEVRKSMLAGDWHPMCERCEVEEKSEITSRRIYEIERWKGEVSTKDTYINTNKDGKIDISKLPLKYSDIRFGNLCNLKCRSCGPTDSSKWYSDYVAIHGNKYTDSSSKIILENRNGNIIPTPNPYTWYEDNNFWNELSSDIKDIRHLYLVGGEPLLIKAHYDFLQKCVEQGFSKNIKLEYNSNITLIPQRALDLWKEFRAVQIGASIDGVGKVNDYIRYPSKWSTICSNLNRIDTPDSNIKILISSTVMTYNILDLVNIMRWKVNSRFHNVNSGRKNPLFTPHPLHRPRHLCIQSIPNNIKTTISGILNEDLQKFIDEVPRDTRFYTEIIASSKSSVDKYVKFMFATDRSEYFDEFISYTKKLDKLRGESFQKSCPDLHQIFANNGFTI